MENKSSSKYYLFGAIILVLVIIIIVLLLKGSKPAEQKPQTESNTGTPTVNTPAPVAPGTPDTSAPGTPDMSVVEQTPDNGLIGTWTSSVKDKGMEGSGKVAIRGTAAQVKLTSDVDLVIQKVENNTADGTITFNNSCLASTISVPGKPDVVEPAQCLSLATRPASLQIDGDKISYTGKSDLGADISLTGTYTNDSISGTFTRTGTSGVINGTFSLVRVKN